MESNTNQENTPTITPTQQQPTKPMSWANVVKPKEAPLDNSDDKKARYLVVDTGALVKGVHLERLASEFYTVEEVFKEVRDKQARRFLETFPFEIKVRQPTPEAYKAVVDFSKKTGDFSSLSVVDLKILALTYTLQKEVGGGIDHIRTEPNREIKKERPKGNILTQQHQQTSANKPSQTTDNKETEAKPEETNVPENEDDDDDEAGWITPDNIIEVTNQLYGEFASADDKRVGCITTDFTMQNVMLQMGLTLISVDGLAIKKVRQWTLRCFGCNKVVKDMEKVFCPACGNNTLRRVSVVIDDNGQITHFFNDRRPINVRGTKYAVPLSKGGRNSGDLILTEDEYKHATRFQKKPKDVDAFDLEWSFGASSGQKHQAVVGYGHKNPNTSRKKVGKNNKNAMRL